MKYILTERQLRLLEQVDKAFTPLEVVLFKRLNQEKEKKKIKKVKDLEEYIKNISLYLGIPENYTKYYTELYRLNYREDGKYEQTTKSEFVDPRKQRGKVIQNTYADEYSATQMPFRGSNLEGEWRKDPKGVKYYVIISFGWYPIYLYKEGYWYEVTERYSSSTGKQMYNAGPNRYSDELKSEIYWATPEEMKLLQRGMTHDEFMKHKVSEFEKKGKENVSTRARRQTIYGPEDELHYFREYKIRFKIKGLRKEGDKGVVDVDVYEVRDPRKNDSVDYMKGDRGITKEFVEQKLKGKIGRELKDYIGKTLHYYADDFDEQKHLLKFNFNHVQQ